MGLEWKLAGLLPIWGIYGTNSTDKTSPLSLRQLWERYYVFLAICNLNTVSSRNLWGTICLLTSSLHQRTTMARPKFTTTLLIALAAATFSAALVHHTCAEALIDEPTPAKCHWRGSAPFCEEQSCPDGYQLIGSDVCGDGWCCWSGVKINCCPKPLTPNYIDRMTMGRLNQYWIQQPICTFRLDDWDGRKRKHAYIRVILFFRVKHLND